MRLFRALTTLAFVVYAATSYAVALAPEIEKSETIVFINGQKFYVHTVKDGDTLYSIAKAYGVTEEVIKEHNKQLGATLKIDQTIKIPLVEKKARPEKRKKKNFVQHKVSEGETLYAIARKYEISVDVIRTDNPEVDPHHLSIGDVVWIRKAEMGESTQEEAQNQIIEYTEQLNSATDDGYQYHVVQAKETIYSLSRRFGITEAEFAQLNDVSNGLKEGAVVRYPAPKDSLTEDVVQKKDTINFDAMGLAHELAAWPEERNSAHENIIFEPLTPEQELNIALMLPLNVNGKISPNFVEFYQGFLLGLEDLKADGHKTILTLYNTAHDPLKVEEIVSGEEIKSANLIVGPVYEDELKPVLDYAQINKVPVVSPLASIEVERSSALFQLSPDAEKKYDKIADLLDGSKDIYLIYAESYDKAFEKEILEQLQGKEYLSYTYSYNRSSIFTPKDGAPSMKDVSSALKNSRPSLFIVLASNETDVDRILGTLSSARTSVRDRGLRATQHTVLGTSRWSRFANIDPNIYFKNNVVMVSTYHAKRNTRLIREFDGRYIASYNTLPSLYSYRGYDTAIIFGKAMRSDMANSLIGTEYTPLLTTYKFSQKEAGEIYVNQEWIRVNYNPNYKITIQ